MVAILRSEPGWQSLSLAIRRDEAPKMSAATLVELHCVADRRDSPAESLRVDALLAKLRIQIIPFDAVQAELARAAYRIYGKGSGSPARLNLGDCFSYALAARTGEPLLFVGDDFTHTDLTPALPA
jgi:ribonuclease VapC